MVQRFHQLIVFRNQKVGQLYRSSDDEPVAFPRVNDLGVGEAVDACGAVELVEEEFDNRRQRRFDVQN